MSYVEYTTEGAVALITLNRPPVNALSSALCDELADAVSAAGSASVRAVVVTGAPHFAAGADITEFQGAFDAGESAGLAEKLSSVVRSLELIPKPVISAVRGFALGGGLELAMGGDFIYLADDAKVGQPEIKLGIIPGAGGTQRLPRLVGWALAKKMVFGGEAIDAETALAAGLASKVVPVDDLLPTAMTDAAAWASGPTRALGAAKTAMNEGYGRPMVDALAQEGTAFGECFGSADAREGVAAFLAKRAPEFSGP